jgi:hypothetical protein
LYRVDRHILVDTSVLIINLYSMSEGAFTGIRNQQPIATATKHGVVVAVVVVVVSFE